MRDGVSTAEVMVRYLAAAGVRHLFGYPGDPNLELIEAARREEFHLVLARREATAAFMAQAYGVLTGLPGVCMSTLGPGSTSLLNGVANAMLDRVPLLAISGQASRRREPYCTHQVVDHARLFGPVCKWAVRMVPESAGIIMRKALRIAVAERPGPVHITTNADVVGAPAGAPDIRLPPVTPVEGSQVFSANGQQGSPARLVEQSRRPMILAGISARRSGATEALVRFAERIGAPVIVAPMAKGVFPENHPNFAGTIDMACQRVMWSLLGEADLFLMVGFDAVELIKEWELQSPVIHIDSTPNTDQIYYAETEIVGHIPTTLTHLGESVRMEPRWESGDIERHRETLADAYYAGRVGGKLNPTDVIDSLSETFPDDTILSTDVGSHKMLVGQGWHPTRPDAFLMTNGLSTMGFSLPAAITAKLLHPHRPAVCTIGDGGFAMVQGELRLASELGLGAVVVVFCDQSLNRIELKQQMREYPSLMTRIAPTDIASLAVSMGCHGEHVDSKSELDRLLREAQGDMDRPLVIGANIDPSQYLAQF